MEVTMLAHEMLSIRKLTSICSNFPFLKRRCLYFHMDLVLVETALKIPVHVNLQKWDRTNGSTVTVLQRVHQNLSALASRRGQFKLCVSKIITGSLKFPSAMVNSGAYQIGAKSHPAIFHCSDTCFQKRKNLTNQSFSWYKSAPFRWS